MNCTAIVFLIVFVAVCSAVRFPLQRRHGDINGKEIIFEFTLFNLACDYLWRVVDLLQDLERESLLQGF